MLVFAFVGLEKADDVLLYLFQLIICTTKKRKYNLFVLFVFVPDFRDVTACRSMVKHNGIRLLNKKALQASKFDSVSPGWRYFVIRLISQMSRPDLPVMQPSDDVGRETLLKIKRERSEKEADKTI